MLRAAFETAYGMDDPVGRTPAREEMLRITPSPVSCRRGAAAWTTFQGPTTFTRRMRSQMSLVAASRSWCGMTLVVPAL